MRASLLVEGLGGARDLEGGAAWLEKAAGYGVGAAMRPLADCYARGLGVARDPERASYWGWRACGSSAEEATAKAARGEIPPAPQR